MSRGILITHKDCLDGATAALIGELSGLNIIFVEPDGANAALAALPEDKNPVFLADVSLTPSQWPQWRNRITHLLDHHQSALHLFHEPNVTVDLSRAGGHLMYDFAVTHNWIKPSPNWERLINTAERYDLWKPHHEAGQNLNRLMQKWGFEWYRSKYSSGWAPYAKIEGDTIAQIIRDEDLFIQRFTEHAVLMRDDRLSIAGVNLTEDGPVNELAHVLLDQGAAMVFMVKPEGRVSARTDVRIDAASLMERLFGGGGHARAAGGRLPHPLTNDDEMRAMLHHILENLTPQPLQA